MPAGLLISELLVMLGMLVYLLVFLVMIHVPNSLIQVLHVKL